MSLQHDFPFDPTYGYDETDLLAVAIPGDIPADFESFWRELAASGRIDPAPEFEGPESGNERCLVRPIRYRSAGGRRIGGWLVTPRSGPIRRLVVVGSGYGGWSEVPEELVMEEAACLYFCARGLPTRSVFEDLPKEAPFHVLAGIQNPVTYVHGGCCADLWNAATVLQQLYGDDLPLHYWGGSFGGGIGALALPWDERFTAAYLVVPSFGNHPLRLEMRCIGSGEAVRRVAAYKPRIVETLRYFDAAVAAQFLQVPTLYACALFDPAVPPPGQFSVWKAHAGKKELAVLSTGHFPTEKSEREQFAADELARAWLLAAEN